jgi:hypothetical protein
VIYTTLNNSKTLFFEDLKQISDTDCVGLE